MQSFECSNCKSKDLTLDPRDKEEIRLVCRNCLRYEEFDKLTMESFQWQQ